MDEKNKEEKYVLYDTTGRDVMLGGGKIEVWKACRVIDPLGKRTDVYVKLEVPADAKRVTPISTEYKSRVSYAFVRQIIDKFGKEYKEAVSFVYRYADVKYVVGKKIFPDGFDEDINETCGHGIHVHKYKEHCDIWFV